MTHTYAFVGLTPSERSLLESIFAMDADESSDERGDEGLVPVRLGVDKVPVNLLIVNGDDLEVVAQLHAAHPEALLVLVGHPPGGQGVRWPVMRRPLDLHGAVSVLSELDWPDTALERSVSIRPRPQAAFPVSESGQPSRPSRSRPPPTAFPSEAVSSAFAPTTARMPISMPAAAQAAAQPGLSARAVWATSERGAAEGQVSSPAHGVPPPSVRMAASAPLAVPPADTVLTAEEEIGAPDAAADARPTAADPVAPAQPPRRADLLVVHRRRDGQIPSLVRGLHDMGYAVHAVGPHEDSLAAVRRHCAAFVFLDQQSLGPAALPLAREIAALRRAPSGLPHLVVVAREGSAFDRLRARLAGCGWMQVPIDGDRLASYLTRRGLPRPDAAR